MTGFKGAVFSQDDMMIAKILCQEIMYNKPLYLGATVTEFAKWLMFNFFYILLRYYYKGYSKVELLFTDIDRLILQVFLMIFIRVLKR